MITVIMLLVVVADDDDDRGDGVEKLDQYGLAWSIDRKCCSCHFVNMVFYL